jgi:hypothetical protein
VGFTDVDLKLPWKKSWASKRYKEEMSEAANDRLRNAQGHFI